MAQCQLTLLPQGPGRTKAKKSPRLPHKVDLKFLLSVSNPKRNFTKMVLNFRILEISSIRKHKCIIPNQKQTRISKLEALVFDHITYKTKMVNFLLRKNGRVPFRPIILLFASFFLVDDLAIEEGIDQRFQLSG